MDCQFNESVFPPSGGEKSVLEERREITWNASSMSHFDHHTNHCELEAQRIIRFQNLANQLPYAFIDTKKVTSHIPTANTPARIDFLEGQLANESKICLKHGRPIDSKDITPWKRRTQMRIDTPKEARDEQKAPEVVYGEQEALAEAYIEQKTLEEVRNKGIVP